MSVNRLGTHRQVTIARSCNEGAAAAIDAYRKRSVLLGCLAGVGIGVLCNLLLRSVTLQTEAAHCGTATTVCTRRMRRTSAKVRLIEES
jgi:hypothetical protein